MVAPHRSKSMDALYRAALAVWPGMTVFWIGDQAHQGGVSGHNPDDTPRVRAEQVDSDDDPEVRALDLMISPRFTAGQARQLVHALITGADTRRLYYVIYDRRIYRRATGFKPEAYSGGDPHTNHVHVSGFATDDNDAAPWTSVLALGEDEMTPEQFAAALLTALTDPGKTGANIRKALRHEMWGRGSGLTVATTLAAIAGKVDLEPAELDAIKAAAREGAASSADQLIAAVLADLPAGTLSKLDVEDALRAVLKSGVDDPPG